MCKLMHVLMISATVAFQIDRKISSIENVSTQKMWHMSTFCWSNVKIIVRLEMRYNREITNIAFFTKYSLPFKNEFFSILVFVVTFFYFYIMIKTNPNRFYWMKQVSKSGTMDIFSYSMTYWKQKNFYISVMTNEIK